MSRLTESKTGDLLRNSDLKTDLNCKIYARLAAYEDTGLEPEEIQRVIATNQTHAKNHREMFEELAKYKQAEAEGRLIVLPCKVGDTVYLIGSNPEYEAKIIGLGVDRSGNVWFDWAQYVENVDGPDELWDEGTFYIDNIGKIVFFTLEEAEKALKEVQG